MADVPVPHDNASREEMAKREIGRTALSSVNARFLVFAFLVTIALAAVIQSMIDVRKGGEGRTYGLPQAISIVSALPKAGDKLREVSTESLWDAVFAANGVLLRAIKDYEKEMEDQSFLAVYAIPRMQALYAQWLGLGNEQAYLGRDRWLFYRPELDYLTGPGFLEERTLQARARSGDSSMGAAVQPDPVPAIIGFHEALKARGIHLVVMPAPVKPMIEPGMMSSRFGPDAPVLHNPSYEVLKSKLRDAGVDLLELEAVLVQTKRESGSPVFLDTDTHWKSEAMEASAKLLASHLAGLGLLKDSPAVSWNRTTEVVNGFGDIAAMLKLLPDQTLYPLQNATIHPVRTADGRAWAADPASDILLLGDSFSNIYSMETLGWGIAAGLAEQLSFELKRPLDVILRNDAGSHATREILTTELGQGKDRLAGKRIVVWQFAEREFSVGDWKRIPLPEVSALPTPRATPEGGGAFYTPRDGGPVVTVTAKVAEVSSVPRPGSVPYRDQIFSVHLVGLEGEGIPSGSQALVYLFGMKDNVLSTASKWRAGDRITVRLSSWDDVASQYERFNRSELDSPDLQFELPAWGEPAKLP